MLSRVLNLGQEMKPVRCPDQWLASAGRGAAWRQAFSGSKASSASLSGQLSADLVQHRGGGIGLSEVKSVREWLAECTPIRRSPPLNRKRGRIKGIQGAFPLDHESNGMPIPASAVGLVSAPTSVMCMSVRGPQQLSVPGDVARARTSLRSRVRRSRLRRPTPMRSLPSA